MERVRRFRFAGSGSDDVPPFRFELFRPLAHPGEDLSHVVAALAGDVVADAVNLGQNCVLVHGSTSHQIIRRANDRAIVAELFAETLDLHANELGDVEVIALPLGLLPFIRRSSFGAV